VVGAAESKTGLGRELIAGLAVGALEISVAASFAFLIFAPLSASIPRVIGPIIVGAGLVAALVAPFTRVKGLIGGLQDAPAVVIAAVVAALVAEVDPAQAEATAMTFIVVVGVLMGIVLMLAGRFRITTSARSLPFTVVSGFLAGTGWLLARAGIEVMVDEGLTWGSVVDLFGWDVLKFWLPGLVLALLVVFGERFDRTGLMFPIGIVVLTLGVHLVAAIVSSLDGLRDGGWLLGPFPETEGWRPVTPSEVADADWGAIVGQVIPVIGLLGVAVVVMVLNVAGVEMETGEDISMEDEVVVAGASATVVALLSGLPGFHQLGGTIMARQLGSRTPIAAGVVLVMCVGVGVFGAGLIALLPRAVAGGVLLTVGLSMLRGWVRQVRLQLNRFEGALSAMILGSIIAFGVLAGIGVGLLAAVVGFVFSYSRVEPVRRVHRLGTSRSVVDRPRADRLVLDAHGDSMFAFELVGYLFFGSIRKVTDLISPLVASGELRYLVLDFSAVRGLDASVVSGLQSIQRRTAEAGVEMIWSGLTDDFATELRRGGADLSEQRHADLDHAFEYVEDAVLRWAAEHGDSDELVPEMGDLILLELLQDRCETIELEPGEHLMEVGAPCEEMFLVKTGTLTAWGVGTDERRTRFRRVGAGSVIGEVAFVAGGVRTATVSADGPATVLRLGVDVYERLCVDDTGLALQVQAELSKRIAERLSYTSAAYQRAMNA
jgi:SulP family sulfate permease